jgi:(5-formylfuran-3-yl)methyl phosphate synthase
MTGMLASVINGKELELAISAGVDIIDLKNPREGALGALSEAKLRKLVTQTAGRLPVSATVGDLPADPALLAEAVGRTADSGVDYVKVGFFSAQNLKACLQAIAGAAAGHPVIAVLFADLEPPLHRLAAFAEAGFRGVMIDTAGKRGGGLTQHLDAGTLGRFVSKTRHLGLLSGLAGSLRSADIPLLLPLAPDYLGFRGALCEGGDRVDVISPRRLQEIRDALPRQPMRAPFHKRATAAATACRPSGG